MASSGFRPFYSFAGFVLHVLSPKNCLIFFVLGGSFEFLRDPKYDLWHGGKSKTHLLCANGAKMLKQVQMPKQ